MNIDIVGVVGAGIRGAAAAKTPPRPAHQVTPVDVADPQLERARGDIRQGLRLRRLMKTPASAEPIDAILARITTTTELDRLADAQFVVENVTERWELKQDVYRELDRVCADPVIFAANTSAISITRIAAATRRPDRVVGVHFMNPVPMKPLVEVIRGFHSSEDALERTRAVLTRMGKDCVVVNDSPGFVSNRVLMLTVNEAIFLVHDQVASAADVDRIFKGCFGHPMGPLETADLIGLDTILLSLEVLHDSFSDSKYRPCPLLRKLVDAGLHGRKSGQGFYTYT